MNYQNFKLSISNGIASVMINRPAKANSLNQQSWDELRTIFEELSTDPKVRVAVLSGEGTIFCAGIDLTMLMSVKQVEEVKCGGRRSEQIMRFIEQLQASVSAIEKCAKPVIAAVHGGCIGGGLDIAAACDLRYCSEDAYFTVKEIDMGMVADLGSLQRLPKFVRPAAVADMAFTGRKVHAKEAKEIGLVNDYFPNRGTLMKEVFRTASVITSKSPLSIRGTKEIIRHSRDHSVADSLHYMSVWNSAHLLSDDLTAAFTSAMTKQPPAFED